MEAYVLIQTERGRKAIAPSLRAMPGVLSADDLRGPYDAIARVRADSTRQSIANVVAGIRKLPGVVRVIPAPLVRSPSEATRGDEAA